MTHLRYLRELYIPMPICRATELESSRAGQALKVTLTYSYTMKRELKESLASWHEKPEVQKFAYYILNMNH